MNTKNKSLLSRLRMAVKKVRLLLSSAVLSRTWQIASVIRRASSLPHKRHLSFSDRSPSGLVICNSVIDEVNTSPDQGSASSNRLIRTASCSSDDDIDKRAEIFINNFRRQLQMERQISLQLRYCGTNSFEPSPWLNSFSVNWTVFKINGEFVSILVFSFWVFQGRTQFVLIQSAWRDDGFGLITDCRNWHISIDLCFF